MKPLRDTVSKSALLGRLLVVYALAILWCGTLVGRLIYLQVYRGEEYRTQARHQQQGFAISKGKRGEILDRNLDELAINIQLYSLTADPELIEDPAGTASALAPILALPAEQIQTQLVPGRRFVPLARKLVPRQAEVIRHLDLPGVFLVKENHRYYPDSGRAAAVLGFVGRDGEGLSGLEYRWDEYLREEQKRVSLELDARRRSYSRQASHSSRDGNTLILNLHGSIQYAAEATLERTVHEHGAKDGSIVVMDPNTGEILALASYPSFDPNHFQDYDAEAYRNRAILQLFEPGSTMKLVTMAAVLAEGLVDWQERIDCRVGTLRLAGKVYREAIRSFDQLTFQEILAKSSNVGTIKLALRLGPDRLHHYLELFGFGQRTGIDLPGEQAGLLRPTSQWSRISVGALAIGQELAVTPLQVLRAMSAIANGGHLVRPYVVRRVSSPEGDVLEEFTPQRQRVLDSATAQLMTRALAGVVTHGTGGAAALKGFSSAGKTGTAQKFVDGRYSDSRYVASYVGFAPVDDPAVAAIVVIDEPQDHYHGGHVAAPAFKEVMEQALLTLRVPPDRPVQNTPPGLAAAELPNSARVSVGEEPLAAEHLEETVLELIETESSGRGAAVLQWETDLVTIPDLRGKSLRAAAAECAERGLQLKVSGSGLAVAQRPMPGRRVRRGTICEVFFSNRGFDASATERTDRQSSSAPGLAERY